MRAAKLAVRRVIQQPAKRTKRRMKRMYTRAVKRPVKRKAKRTATRLVGWAAGAIGMDIDSRSVRRRTTKHEVLEHTLKLGFRPQTVIDVGVGNGTPWLYERSGEANLLLVEPLIEYKPVLDSIIREARNARYVLAAAGSEVGMKTISLCSEWLQASSLYHGPTASSIRTVPVTTLDKLCAELHLTGPYLIKVDVEGAELDVLDGAQRILEDTQLVFLEVSFFQYFSGAPLFDDVVRYMKERDFGIYDIVDRKHRVERDGRSLAQADVAFVKEGSKFRPSTPTWSARLHA